MNAGIDAGMRLVKLCLVGRTTIFASRCFEMDANFERRCSDALAACAHEAVSAGFSSGRIRSITATGYGASLVRRARAHAAEDACIAAAALGTSSPARSVIDAGGLFIKIHRIAENGRATETVTSEKCAAGSGRFLEIAAQALKMPFEALAGMDLADASPFHITGSCAVFAESELISRIGRGTPARDILAGVVRSLALKTVTLMDHAGAADPVAITGGLSSVTVYVDMVRKISGREITILQPGPVLTSAYGAALIGASRQSGPAARFAARLMPWRSDHA